MLGHECIRTAPTLQNNPKVPILRSTIRLLGSGNTVPRDGTGYRVCLCCEHQLLLSAIEKGMRPTRS